MYRSDTSLLAIAGLALAITLAIIGPSNAQGGEDGIGAVAGIAPPIEDNSMGAAAPDAASPMDAPPVPPPDEGAGQAAPEPETAAPEENKTPAPEENGKNDGPPNPD